jgi:hypothetical protein
MTRKTATVLMGVFGMLAFVAIVGLSLGAWFFASVFESTSASMPAATAAFDAVRTRFAGVEPVFDIVNDEELVVRRPAPDRVAAPPERVQIRYWDPDDQGLSSVTLPVWLLRLKAGPVTVATHLGHAGLTVEQLERYGRTLLVDHVGPGGDRLLIWTE